MAAQTDFAEPPEDRRGDTAARLHSVAIHLLRRVRRDDPELGLGPARLSALSVLVFGGPRSMGDLAEAEQVTPPTMTRLIAGLESDGYVTRKVSETDRRVVILRATGMARRALEAARRRRVRRMLELLSGLSDADWVRLDGVVALLEEALSASSGA